MPAKKQAPKIFTSWSFSRWNDYTACPFFAKCKYLDKVVTDAMAQRQADMAEGKIEPGPMERGEDIAKKTQAFLDGKVKNLPVELMPLAPVYRDLKKRGNLSVEQSWGFTREWRPCSPTDWDACWLRVKIDVARVEEGRNADTLHIKDNKTGKFRDEKNEEYQLQLELYGVAGLVKMPTVATVTAQLLYSDLGIVYPEQPTVFTTDDTERLKALWNKRVKPMFADTRFAPRPSKKCYYCEFSKKRGGPCKY